MLKFQEHTRSLIIIIILKVTNEFKMSFVLFKGYKMTIEYYSTRTNSEMLKESEI